MADKKSLFARYWWTAIIAAATMAFIAYQVNASASASVVTKQAVTAEAEVGVSADGYFLRHEQVIRTDLPGARVYEVQNGAHVSAGGAVAKIYASEQDASAVRRAAALSARIRDLKTLDGAGAGYANVDALRQNFQQSWLGTLTSVDAGDLAGAYAGSAAALYDLNLQQLATGEVSGFSGQIAGLQSQLDALGADAIEPAGTVTAPAAGYFVDALDGFETSLAPDSLGEPTPSKLRAAKADTAGTSAAGKVETDFSWTLACIVSEKDAQSIRAAADGGELTARIPGAGAREVPVSFVCAGEADSQGQCVVSLACNYMNGRLAMARKAPVGLVLRHVSGLQLPVSALYTVDGARGVYIKKNGQAVFEPVQVLYESKAVALCTAAEAGKAGLHLYDDVIIEGKGLYNGKHVS